MRNGAVRYADARRSPGWEEFLEDMAEKYEMHVYTMGTRAYAEEVCAAIDPEGKIFGGRLLSRDESGSKSDLCPFIVSTHTEPLYEA